MHLESDQAKERRLEQRLEFGFPGQGRTADLADTRRVLDLNGLDRTSQHPAPTLWYRSCKLARRRFKHPQQSAKHYSSEQ